MKALVYRGPRDIAYETMKDPELHDDRDAIIKVDKCAICGSDLPNFRGGLWPHPAAEDGWGAVRAPGFPLHEIVGEVVASRHPDHSPGDLVVGDGDGVVVVERETVASLLAPAAQKVTDERLRIEEITSGRNIRPVWLQSALRATGLLQDGETL